jgi:hypothetical protein
MEKPMVYITDQQCRQLRKYWDSLKIEQRIRLLDAARSIESDAKYSRGDVVAISRIMVLMMDGALSAVLEDGTLQETSRKQNALVATLPE